MVLVRNLTTFLCCSMVFVMMMASRATAQSRCDTACALDMTCKTGLCVLTRCSDDGSCHEYCLNCAGVETCYATGNTCDYGGNTIRLASSSSGLKSSISLVLIPLVSSFLAIFL